MANALGVDEQLAAGESRTSDNGGYRLDMQADGNLVLYRTGDTAPLWASQTAGRGGTRAVMQGDGNLVIYGDGDGDAVWASQTAGHQGASLAVQDDGNVVIYASGAPLWATETATGTTGEGGGAATASAAGTVVGGGPERVYVTKAGDTLEALAGFFYGDPAHRQRLLDDNPELAQQGGDVPAGTRLRVPEDPTRGDTVAT